MDVFAHACMHFRTPWAVPFLPQARARPPCSTRPPPTAPRHIPLASRPHSSFSSFSSFLLPLNGEEREWVDTQGGIGVLMAHFLGWQDMLFQDEFVKLTSSRWISRSHPSISGCVILLCVGQQWNIKSFIWSMFHQCIIVIFLDLLFIWLFSTVHDHLK